MSTPCATSKSLTMVLRKRRKLADLPRQPRARTRIRRRRSVCRRSSKISASVVSRDRQNRGIMIHLVWALQPSLTLWIALTCGTTLSRRSGTMTRSLCQVLSMSQESSASTMSINMSSTRQRAPSMKCFNALTRLQSD